MTSPLRVPGPGRPAGAKDRAPRLKPRRTQQFLDRVLDRAESGDPVAQMVVVGAALIAARDSEVPVE
jgi:hypothetical protein